MSGPLLGFEAQLLWSRETKCGLRSCFAIAKTQRRNRLVILGLMTSQVRHNMDAPNEKPLPWNVVLGRGGGDRQSKVRRQRNRLLTLTLSSVEEERGML